ncbi:hypothetical protein D3C80_687580 [compost metagenome]
MSCDDGSLLKVFLNIVFIKSSLFKLSNEGLVLMKFWAILLSLSGLLIKSLAQKLIPLDTIAPPMT